MGNLRVASKRRGQSRGMSGTGWRRVQALGVDENFCRRMSPHDRNQANRGAVRIEPWASSRRVAFAINSPKATQQPQIAPLDQRDRLMNEPIRLTAGIRILPLDGTALGVVGGEHLGCHVSRTAAQLVNVVGVKELDQSPLLKRRQPQGRWEKTHRLAAKLADQVQRDVARPARLAGGHGVRPIRRRSRAHARWHPSARRAAARRRSAIMPIRRSPKKATPNRGQNKAIAPHH